MLAVNLLRLGPIRLDILTFKIDVWFPQHVYSHASKLCTLLEQLS